MKEETGIHVCPITRVAELLSDTWTMLIMRALTEDQSDFVSWKHGLEKFPPEPLL
jgi:DNA-binding HxlR family transcriptional regulator